MNVDLVFEVPALPGPGITMLASTVRTGPRGKGRNPGDGCGAISPERGGRKVAGQSGDGPEGGGSIEGESGGDIPSVTQHGGGLL